MANMSLGTNIVFAAKQYRMAPSHDPPDSFKYNTVREAGGSTRLTMLKAAVDEADIDPSPPRPVFAHIPAAEGIWLAFAVDAYDSQLTRVQVRTALTEAVSPETRIVGEYPIPVTGKLGSAITLVPKRLAEAIDLSIDDGVTTIAVAPELLLFATEDRIASMDVEAALDATRDALPD
jgi:hypothetical protein